MDKGIQRYLIVRNENANKNYTTEFVQQLFSEEGKGEVIHLWIYSVEIISSLQHESMCWDMLNKVEAHHHSTEISEPN